MEQHKSDLAFNLIIDESRCEVLQILCSCLMIHMDNFVMSHPDRVAFVIPTLKDMVKEIADKQHELGWCKDDDCQWSGHNHEKN